MTIQNNGDAGIAAENGASVLLGGGSTITGTHQGIRALGATVSIQDATISTSPTSGDPAILAYRSTIGLISATVTGANNANTVAALSGSNIILGQSMLQSSDATDATLLVSDGSSVLSFGANTYENDAVNGAAVTVQNGSTFIEDQNAVVKANSLSAGADSFIGAGTVQMQSNMELGTGATTPSNWTGSISVAQNSSFRLHGGITISGGVTIGQGSNGFFNKTAGGTNTVNGTHVACLGTASTHIVGNAAVTPNVTLVTTGAGCYSF